MKRILCAVIAACFAAYLTTTALAVSADVSLGSGGREIECDGTQRTATLHTRGGSIMNKSATSVWVNLEGDTVATSSGSTSIEIAQNTSIRLPSQCKAFTFKTTGATSYLIYLAP